MNEQAEVITLLREIRDIQSERLQLQKQAIKDNAEWKAARPAQVSASEANLVAAVRDILARHYARMGTELNEARLRMARIPEGAVLIDNPISAAPGFSLGNVHVMAGVPNIFQAMVASLLPRLTGGRPLLSLTLRVMRGEGMIAAPLAALAKEFSDLSFGSYPFVVNGAYGTNLVVRGQDAVRLDQAMVQMLSLFGEVQE